MARQAFYIDASSATEGGFIPSLVTENEAGHTPLSGNGPFATPWVWGPSFEQAQEQAREANEKRGLSEDDVLDIVTSSMFAGAGGTPRD
jgi:hypothetical protein